MISVLGRLRGGFRAGDAIRGRVGCRLVVLLGDELDALEAKQQEGLKLKDEFVDRKSRPSISICTSATG